MTGVWQEIDAAQAKYEAEVALAKSALHDLAKSWRLLEPAEPYWWRASHPKLGRIEAKNWKDLIAKAKRLTEGKR